MRQIYGLFSQAMRQAALWGLVLSGGFMVSSASANEPFENRAYFKAYKDKALSGYNDDKLTGVSLDQCMRACATSVEFLCRSFDYDDARNVCYLSHATATYGGGLVSSRKYDHYQNNMGFRRIKRAALPKNNHKRLDNRSPEQCRQACKSETSFECRSFDYNFQENYCHLSRQRGTHPVGFKAEGNGLLSSELLTSLVKDSTLVASQRFDHYIRVRPDYIHVETPDDVFTQLGAEPNSNPMSNGMRCKFDPWRVRGANEAKNDNTACSDPTGVVRAADKRKFNNACRRHDVCYSSPGGQQSNCDSQFGQDLGKICNKVHDDGSPNWQICMGATGTMTTAVAVGGRSSWTGGQDWARDNCIAGGDRLRN